MADSPISHQGIKGTRKALQAVARSRLITCTLGLKSVKQGMFDASLQYSSPYQCPPCCFIAASARFWSLSGERSSLCVENGNQPIQERGNRGAIRRPGPACLSAIKGERPWVRI